MNVEVMMFILVLYNAILTLVLLRRINSFSKARDLQKLDRALHVLESEYKKEIRSMCEVFDQLKTIEEDQYNKIRYMNIIIDDIYKKQK